MSLHASRVLGSKRHFAGENESYRLIEWLNTTKKRVAKSRVLEIHELLAELFTTNTNKDNPVPHDPKTKWNRLRARINKKLLNYPLCHQLIWFRNPYFVTAQVSLSSTKAKRGGGLSEAGAVFAILSVFRQPEGWRRIAKCDCGKYYFRRFSHQRFCSEKCRLKEFHSSDEWKEHRRKKLANTTGCKSIRM